MKTQEEDVRVELTTQPGGLNVLCVYVNGVCQFRRTSSKPLDNEKKDLEARLAATTFGSNDPEQPRD